jgi:PIN domain nuclease of toxin-antitoxin system
VNFLLDTSIFLWALTDPSRLTSRAHGILTGQREALWLSAASAWEIAVKNQLGKLPLPESPARCIPEWMKAGGIHTLDITHRHALGVGELPLHHQDPFDRILITQARLEGMVLLTADRIFKKYEVETIWCGR